MVPNVFKLKELFVFFLLEIDSTVVRVGRNSVFVNRSWNKLWGTRPQPTNRLDR